MSVVVDWLVYILFEMMMSKVGDRGVYIGFWAMIWKLDKARSSIQDIDIDVQILIHIDKIHGESVHDYSLTFVSKRHLIYKMVAN